MQRAEQLAQGCIRRHHRARMTNLSGRKHTTDAYLLYMQVALVCLPAVVRQSPELWTSTLLYWATGEKGAAAAQVAIVQRLATAAPPPPETGAHQARWPAPTTATQAAAGLGGREGWREHAHTGRGRDGQSAGGEGNAPAAQSLPPILA